MKKCKQIVCALLAVSVIFALTACANTGSESGTVSLSPDATPVPMQEGPSYTWDTSDFELDWFVNVSYWKWPGDYGNDYLSDLLKRRTGATINFIIPAGQGDTQLMTMIASETLPDIVTCSDDIRYKMAGGGLLWSYDDLIRVYAPTFSDTIEKIQDVYDWYREYDGKTYGLPNYASSENYKEEGELLSPYMCGVLRSDLYQKIGSPDVSTPDAFLNALERVKNEIKSYDGQPIIPLQLYEFTIYGCASFTALGDYFSVPFENPDGTLARSKEENFEVYRFLNEAYNRGLISVENFSDSREIINEKIASGRVFSIFSAIQDFTPYMASLYDHDNNAKYEAFVMNNYQGESPSLRDVSGFGYQTTSITKKASQPDRCVRLIEYLMSDEGQIEMLFGAKDETQYTIDDNGYVVWTQGGNLWNAYAGGDAKGIKYYTLGFNLLTDYLRTRGYYAPATDARSIATQEYYIKKPLEQYTYDGKLRLYKEDMSDPRKNEMDIIENKISLYWGQQIPKIIMAPSAAEARAIYDQTLAKAKEMGSDTLYEYRNECFQRTKQLLGVKYACPENNG